MLFRSTVGFDSATVVGEENVSFLPRRNIFFGNTGISPGGLITVRHLPWVPVRGVGLAGTRTLGYDGTRDRIYYFGWDMRPLLVANDAGQLVESNENVIVTAWSDNEGKSWSDQFVVNKVQNVSAGMPSGAVDPKTGYVAMTWYDPRADPIAQQKVEFFGTVFNGFDAPAQDTPLVGLPASSVEATSAMISAMRVKPEQENPKTANKKINK